MRTSRRVNGAIGDYGAVWSAKQIKADSFTDSGIDAADNWKTRLG